MFVRVTIQLDGMYRQFLSISEKDLYKWQVIMRTIVPNHLNVLTLAKYSKNRKTSYSKTKWNYIFHVMS